MPGTRLRSLAIATSLAAVVICFAAAQGTYFPTAWGWASLLLLWAAGLFLVLSLRVEVGRAEIVEIALLASLSVWIVISLIWSRSTPETVEEFERTLVYLAGAAAFVLLARPAIIEHLLAGILAALTGICLYALITRLFPRELSADVFGGYRLSTPVGYWNALGLVGAMGALLSIGFVGSRRALIQRMLAAASVPVLVTTAYFTFSRGTWVALAAGLVFVFAASPQRYRMASALLTLVPAAAVAVFLASRSQGLTETGSSLAAASRDGHRLAIWLSVLVAVSAGCTAVLQALEQRWERVGQIAALTLAGVVVATVVAGVIAAGGPADLARRGYDRFTSAPSSSSDLNQRLFNVSSSGRVMQWRVAWNEFTEHPILGTGAGTYEIYWNETRPSAATVRDTHNVYLETIAELGVVGLGLLLGVLAIPFLGVRARREPLVVAALAAYTALLVDVVYEWDWELPGVFLPGFLCGLAALVAARDETRTIAISRRARAILLGAVGVCAAFAFVALIGNISASRAQSAVDHGHYAKALSNAQRAADWAPWSGRPWFILGTAQARLGRNVEAVKSLRTAIRKDPTNYRYWLALSAVSSGKERLAALQQVFRLNPRYRSS